MAGLVGATGDKDLADPVEDLLRQLMETIEGPEATEAYASLTQALIALDGPRGNRLAAIASTAFFTRRGRAAGPGRFPWGTMHPALQLTQEDYQVLLGQGGDEARAAVQELQAFGVGTLLVADRGYPTKLDEAALEALAAGAEAEQDSDWQRRYAIASVQAHAGDLLPWLLGLAESAVFSEGTAHTWHTHFGINLERPFAYVFRAIGYLARLRRDADPDDTVAAEAAALLRQRYDGLTEDDDRSIRIALCTALGYLGQWEPILTGLGPGEPWMHQAAENVFNHWVSQDRPERERAAKWIVRRLRQRTDLDPEVKATLQEIQQRLERDIGRHIDPEAV
ncbi:MAG: hypothetical protein ACYSWU_09315 [Planctomycetota bacterium]